jgi:hypothetical protein
MALRLEATLKTFLDRKAVIDAVDRAELRVLKKFGAFTMRTARKSIKEKKGSAPAGRPPHAHSTYVPKPGKRKKATRKRLRFRDSILFGYDAGRKSVVIGPYLFEARRGKTVPELLEVGGRNSETGNSYAPHPFMGPAFEHEKRVGLPKILKDCVTR